MADLNRVTRVTTQSWGGRLRSSMGGVVFGLIMVVVSFPLLFWNEGRAVRRAQALSEGLAVVVAADASQIDPANDGMLIHLTGRAAPQGTLTDPEFNIEVEAISLQRNVSMYQWRESSESEERNKLGGGTETVTTYTYEKVWSSGLIDSSEFEEPAGHENPTDRLYDSREVVSSEVFVGPYKLSSSLAGSIGGAEDLPVTAAMIPAELQGRATVARGGLYIGADPASPQIGDVRIAFEQVPATEVSIVARQGGGGLGPFTTSGGGSIELLKAGTHEAAAMFASAQSANVALTWVLRGVGFLLMWFGLAAIFNPLSVLADVVPVVGRIVGVGTGLIAFLLAAVLSLLIIAIAWIYARPLLGVALLAIAAVFGYLIVRRTRGAKPATA